MIQIRFASTEHQRKALGWLPGRFPFKSWLDGRMIVPAQALQFMAVAGMAFVVDRPITLEECLATNRAVESRLMERARQAMEAISRRG